jgi:hypothetical protein
MIHGKRTAHPSGGYVGVEPFKSNSLEIRREGRVAMPNQRDTLTGLKVVFGNDKFRAGDIVYFEGDQCVQLWAKRVYTLDETKFILAPTDMVRILEREIPQQYPAAVDG